jgi:DedD protein
MDRRVKERLVGASILVVLLVLIVPELLSGPAPPPAPSPTPNWPGAVVPRAAAPAGGTPAGTLADGTQTGGTPPAAAPAVAAPERTVTVDLATSKAPAQEAGVEAAAAPPHAAPPALLESSVPPPTSTPGGAKSGAGPPAADPPATRLPGAALQSVVGRAWAVQLGSFASRDNADKLVRQWRGLGFSVYVSSVGAGTAARHRVRIGPLADHESAAQTVAKLKSLGQTASIVRPGA